MIINDCELLCLFPSTRLGGKWPEKKDSIASWMWAWDSTTDDLILVLILLLTRSLAWGKLSDCPPIQNSVLSSIKWKNNSSHFSGLFWGIVGSCKLSTWQFLASPAQVSCCRDKRRVFISSLRSQILLCALPASESVTGNESVWNEWMNVMLKSSSLCSLQYKYWGKCECVYNPVTCRGLGPQLDEWHF